MDQHIMRGQVIHVNEDGWVVINRGTQDGVAEGQKFVVLSERTPRQIHDLFPARSTDGRASPVVLQVSTAYELLRVILVESACCVAISDRVPPERTPQPFLGPQGELLLYTPPPPDWRYDALDLDEAEPADHANEDEQAERAPDTDNAGPTNPANSNAPKTATIDPATQQDRLWDGALPLNALQVGDEVVLAHPYIPGTRTSTGTSTSGSLTTGYPLSSEGNTPSTPQPYDWFKSA